MANTPAARMDPPKAREATGIRKFPIYHFATRNRLPGPNKVFSQEELALYSETSTRRCQGPEEELRAMSLMHAVLMAVALTAPGTPDDLELIEFTATWCAPCRQMEPVMAEARAKGYQVTAVDVDQQVDLARQHGVSRVPTLLIISGGQVIDRVEGTIAAPDLWQRLDRLASSPPPSREPPRTERSVKRNAVNSRSGKPSNAQMATEQRALEATVRLRVDDPDGHSYGSGTIIDAHGEEALILTCGHIFRDSKGKGKISVDLCGLAQPQTIAGTLIRYDLDRDVALVAVSTKVRLTSVPIARANYQVSPGQPLFSLGCNHGQEPTILRGPLRAVNQYLGPENLVVAGQPVDGRSGGGLFSYDGCLVGVCNAADPERAEGLYAAYMSIHRHLDEAKLAFIYQQPQASEDSQLAQADFEQPADEDPDLAAALANSARGRQQKMPDRSGPEAAARALPGIHGELPPRGAKGGSLDRFASSATPPPRIDHESAAEDERAQSDFDSQLDSQLARLQAEGAEVICIVRPRKDPNAKSQVFVLDQPSRGFLNQLEQEQTDQFQRQATQHRVPRTRRLEVTQPETR